MIITFRIPAIIGMVRQTQTVFSRMVSTLIFPLTLRGGDALPRKRVNQSPEGGMACPGAVISGDEGDRIQVIERPQQ